MESREKHKTQKEQKMTAQHELANAQEQLAINKYNRRYNNGIYTAATTGKSTRHANALMDDAMAICGHPHYKLSNRRWSSEALEFLGLFVEREGERRIRVSNERAAKLFGAV